eukprot:1194851-Prorocentrum_minimum.AAC.8
MGGRKGERGGAASRGLPIARQRLPRAAPRRGGGVGGGALLLIVQIVLSGARRAPVKRTRRSFSRSVNSGVPGAASATAGSSPSSSASLRLSSIAVLAPMPMLGAMLCPAQGGKIEFIKVGQYEYVEYSTYNTSYDT